VYTSPIMTVMTHQQCMLLGLMLDTSSTS